MARKPYLNDLMLEEATYGLFWLFITKKAYVDVITKNYHHLYRGPDDREIMKQEYCQFDIRLLSEYSNTKISRQALLQELLCELSKFDNDTEIQHSNFEHAERMAVHWMEIAAKLKDNL